MLLEDLSDTKFSGFLDGNLSINNDVYCLNKGMGWSNELKEYLELSKRKNILEKLKNFRNSDESVLFIDNFPTGNLPNTPTRKGFVENEYIITPIKFIFALFFPQIYGKLNKHLNKN